jgi:small ligand-binding sensory domain FIST
VLAADPDEAGRHAAAQARAQLGGLSPSFAVLFGSAHFLGSAESLLRAVTKEVGPVPLIGCVAEAVAGGAREIESEPAVSLWLAAGLGPVETFAMEFVRTPSGGAYGGYRFEPGSKAVNLMVCDPFTFPVDHLLHHLNTHVPGTVIMGGMASGGLPQRQSRLFLDDQVVSEGAVGARLAAAGADLLVSQGCRPVGQPYTVTAADGSVMHELAGQPALVRLRELVEALPVRDAQLLSQGVHVGLAINEYQDERRQGDFVIRGVVAADPESGSVVVGDEVEVGQTVQFHVRDADSADEDLRRALDLEAASLGGRPAAGALLFTCNGRGTRMFSEPGHDAGLIARSLGDVPAAGLFCAGELGPVGGRNYVHTFTASVAVFPQEAG